MMATASIPHFACRCWCIFLTCREFLLTLAMYLGKASALRLSYLRAVRQLHYLTATGNESSADSTSRKNS